MKFVIGIIIVALLMGALVTYLVLMLNSIDMVYCGDIISDSGSAASVTRIYTTDLSADQALSEIVIAMNNSEDAVISDDELTEILATYQNVIYAPVFTVTLEQADTSTFILTGSVYNGLDEKGEPTSPDFEYKDLGLTLGVSNGTILAAQNVYADDGNEEVFIERNRVVDPVITDESRGASFAFHDCDSFRIIFTQSANQTASVTMAYTYDVEAVNPLDFTSISDGTLGITVTVAYDEKGNLDPQISLERVVLAQAN